ncbi:fimbrial isopeptide formation D2 family protein/LPXTG-motif cell wall-anchored protein [Aequitasia blattaphilus]|uniref:SpaH/EbpB family LPXTG-anchored major pilin n=1 Tax=Aequitasia blattaphilus TaxID=2949332 RepID=A0ABT1EC87_9FIRM|nr:SpaH/EbpB family LPXTG-anchored major pilin [Aequitasia blattaphilus]MCP1103453.1 SpaH/EbpB family LPXTG-anchored major pilin [Aequitasia blattaphilus]MCR8616093.1 SpaH/EbpB family LPXTG-anchored major pilin [Aequitasia blattaphilus]
MKKLKSVLSLLMVAMLVLTSGINVKAAPIDTTKDVTFTIHKYDSTVIKDNGNGQALNPATDLAGAKPLENVEFKIYKTNIEQSPGEEKAWPIAKDVLENKGTYGIVDADAVTMKTNSSGEATTTISAANQGIYLVEEINNPALDNGDTSAVANKLGEPFLISLPMTNADGTDWNYAVHAYPKNKVKDGPEVEKEIEKAGQTSQGANVGDDVTWRIVSEIPSDLCYLADDGTTKIYAKEYKITDALSAGLTYKSVSFKTIKGAAETALALTTPGDYTVSPSGVEDGPVTVVVTLTNAGKEKVQNTKADKLVVGITTTVNKAAISVDSITNVATLNYTNSLNYSYEKNTQDGSNPNKPKPDVHTGSTGLTKVKGSNGTVLGGAKFAISDTAANAKAGKYIKRNATTGKITLPGASDYSSTSDPIYEVESDATTGYVQFEGLAYGPLATDTTDYYVMETFAPSGYQLLKNPVIVKVGQKSSLTTITDATKVHNNEKFILPKTGGMGTILFTGAGILLMGAAILIIRKSKKNNA